MGNKCSIFNKKKTILNNETSIYVNQEHDVMFSDYIVDGECKIVDEMITSGESFFKKNIN